MPTGRKTRPACSPECYYSTSPASACECACGGQNHGQGTRPEATAGAGVQTAGGRAFIPTAGGDSQPAYLPDNTTIEGRAWRTLQDLHEHVPDLLVIGGYGVWIRERTRLSHDLDLIATHEQIAQIGEWADGPVERSPVAHSGGQKWKAQHAGVGIDLYVPHQSRLGGKLKLRVETLAEHSETVDGWRVLTRPALIAAKWAALVDRPDSSAGEKDADDLLALTSHPDTAAAGNVMRACSMLSGEGVDALIADGFRYLNARAPKAARPRLRTLEHQWLNH